MYEHQVTQFWLQQYCGFHRTNGRYQLILAGRLKRRLPRLSDQMQSRSDQHNRIQERVKWRTLDWQDVLEARQRKAKREKGGLLS
jgi:hypothetical protein